MQVKQALEQRFPGIEVQGGAYPVAPTKVCKAIPWHLTAAYFLWLVAFMFTTGVYLGKQAKLPVSASGGFVVQALLGKAMMILQFSILGFVVFGDQLFAALGMQAPPFYADIRDKKLVFGMGTWFLGNMVQSSLNSTGAFEVFFAGAKVMSFHSTSPSFSSLFLALLTCPLTTIW